MPPNLEAVIGLYKNSPTVCRSYDPRAPELAQQIGEMISAHLPTVTVEHIGSTAVEGCAGKGIVDLMILYPDGQLEAVKALLDALGFQRQTTRDPFPEERPMRVGSLEYQGTAFQLHAHVISANSPEAVELREFRDRLRADPTLRAAYGARKREIIEAGVTDPIDYSVAKGRFVEEVLSSAK